MLSADVVVVGGGPAGLTVAYSLATSGADVVLIDESESLGGQYYRRRSPDILEDYGDFRPKGAALIRAARQAGVRDYIGRVAWGIERGDRLVVHTSAVSDEPRALRFETQYLVVAAGAFERSMPFEGWTLPGVVTPGYALHLATCDRVALGKRVVVAGSGPFLLVAASAIVSAGGGVAAVVELNTPYRVSWLGLQAGLYPGRMLELGKYLGTLALHRVPILQGRRIVRAEGASAVTHVSLRRSDASRQVESLECDGLAVGFGFRPASELLQLLKVDGLQDPFGDFYPLLDEEGATSQDDVYAVGEVARGAGVGSAIASGVIVAAAIARRFGHRPPNRLAVVRARRRLQRANAFAGIVSQLFPSEPRDWGTATDGTIVCRCESVSAWQIREATGSGWMDVDGVKAATRAGMGPCQGRECALAVRQIVLAAGARQGNLFSVRQPVKPIRCDAIESEGAM